MKFKQWEKFESGDWQHEINVRDFIQRNYTPYEGNDSFLTGTTPKTQKLWEEVLELYKKDLADGNLQRLYSLNEIFADQYNSQDYYVDILSREGYVIASYQGHQIELTITSYGKRFCETSSYSQPNVPITKQM